MLQACDSNKKDNLSPIPGNGIILAFGDSLTVGKGVSKNNSYPSILAKLSGRKVVSSGVSGETTTAGLKRFKKVIEKIQPDLVILLEGGNDILRNHNKLQIKKNLSSMIDLAIEQGIQVVLIGVPAKSLFTSSSASLYEELAGEYNLVLDAELIPELLHDRAYKSDSVHFNQAGYQKMAETIHALLVENGAL